jgi:hypothetical protein
MRRLPPSTDPALEHEKESEAQGGGHPTILRRCRACATQLTRGSQPLQQSSGEDETRPAPRHGHPFHHPTPGWQFLAPSPSKLWHFLFGPGLELGTAWFRLGQWSVDRMGSRHRAIHPPCDSKPGGLVTEWVRRLLHAAFGAAAAGARQTRMGCQTCLVGFPTGSINGGLLRVACDSHA